MRARAVLATALVILIALAVPASARIDAGRAGRAVGRSERFQVPDGFRPAVTRIDRTGRYFVQLKTTAVIGRGELTAAAQRSASASVLRSQEGAIGEVESLGGRVIFRYSTLVNAFSAQMSAATAAELARRPDVRLVEPVAIVVRANETSVPFIGATSVWSKLNVRGKGVTVAVVDTGVDYTHADFNGSGDPADYEANDPAVIEPGSFPTGKVIAGYDFVGDNYSVTDDDPTNDIPVPDPDPLDDGTVGDHGTHVAGTCCGVGVPGVIGKGVAPKAKIVAVKVWDSGDSTADVLVAGYEFAMDPNQDGSTSDAVDVISFSGGVDYGPPSSTEARAAQAVVDGGTVFVAAAGNSGNQPAGGPAYILGTPAAAPGVIAVSASIDQFVAQQLTVNAPAGVTLPDGGPIVPQEWGPSLDADLSGDILDAREFDAPADPGGEPVPTDRILCDATPAGTPFAGKLALIFKGPFGAGDCLVDDKVLHAQEAGAIGVVIWDGFGGLPGQISPGDSAQFVTIPSVDLSGNDAAVLAAALSPNAGATYNDVAGNVTLGAEGALIPGYEDHMVGFTSEGPARISSALKPDIAAPGSDIRSADAGTGTGAVVFSGTSMATPHVSGVAALLTQIHPDWSPKRIKALLMNQATQDVTNLDGSSPVPATVMGSGRVQAFESARATNLATPGSLSLKLQGVSDLTTIVKTVTLRNLDGKGHSYEVSGDVRYTDFSSRFASVRVAVGDEQLAAKRTFSLRAGKSVQIHVEVTLSPADVPKWQQEWGWYYVNPNVDGNVNIEQTDGKGDDLHVPWHASALAVADTGVGRSSLDLTGGPASLKIVGPTTGGLNYADLYLLGAKSPSDAGNEADIAQIGARTFVGPSVDGTPEGQPEGTDALAGIGWLDFLTRSDVPTETVEFGVHTYGTHNTTDTMEVDVLIDVGADGTFADDTIGADALLVLLPGTGSGGAVCLFNLPSDFSACDAEYFAHYSIYNANVVGLAVDAGALGLTDAKHLLSYSVVACTGVFAGDVPKSACDAAGDLDPATGTYGPTIDVTDPALTFSNQVVRGFWKGAAGPVDVSVGSASPGDDPGILVLFPNNAPGNQATVVTTST